MKKIFTVGYSSFGVDSFVSTLKCYFVEVLFDVRSVPYSRAHPAFNKENIRFELSKNGIVYCFLGEHCGARVSDKALYSGNRVDFEKVAVSSVFRRGVGLILDKACNCNVAIMCAERDPISCHRMILISKALKKYEVEIFHILSEYEIEENAKAELRLLNAYNLDFGLLSQPFSANLETAYAKQGQKIAFRDNAIE